VSEAPRWLAGGARHRDAALAGLAEWMRGGPGSVLLADKPGRRRLARVDATSAGALFLKIFPRPVSALEGTKRLLGLSPDAREWRMLARLHAAGLAVPEPLAHVELANGDRIVVTRFERGVPLADALGRRGRERRALLAELAALVRRMHACGVVHRDLHVGNLLATPHGLVLLDWQSALPVRLRGARLRDLGELDASLAPRLSHADRTRVAAAVLGLARPFGAHARAQLREVARARLARARAHWRSRTRRSLRAGRQYAPLAIGSARGLRLRDVDESHVAERFARDALRFETRGALDALGQALRGTPARRAWLAAAGLRARGVACERPLAWLETRRLGVPLRSALLLEALPPADSARARAELPRLRAELEACDVAHGALDEAALRVAPDGRLALGRLESVRFVRSAERARAGCQRVESVTQR
jgi:tRNA A-37 threonylcarbamoyl transferase component Bud32